MLSEQSLFPSRGPQYRNCSMSSTSTVYCRVFVYSVWLVFLLIFLCSKPSFSVTLLSILWMI
ncbi:transmembrane protein, putative [Medicago truncatula]|uniref:Transmembrane protein, putative n=1 Tax=Medicago truncatula TaxID=3880 RepID=A0A072UC84_MEDTR|nr:transmembrane protein, putative [Medicago truncatula]